MKIKTPFASLRSLRLCVRVLCVSALALTSSVHAGTNAAVTFNTNTSVINPPAIWRANAAGLYDALTNAGYSFGGGSGGGGNSNFFAAGPGVTNSTSTGATGTTNTLSLTPPGLTNALPSWMLWNDIHTNYYAVSPDRTIYWVSNDFAGLLQRVHDSGVQEYGASIHVAASTPTALGGPVPYILSNTVVITHDGIVLSGEGDPATVFRPASGGTNALIQLGTLATEEDGICQINGIRFEGQTGGTNCCAVRIINAAEPSFVQDEFHYFSFAGIWDSDANYQFWSFARQCFFNPPASTNAYGIYIDATTGNSTSGSLQCLFTVADNIFGAAAGVNPAAFVFATNNFLNLDILDNHFYSETYNGLQTVTPCLLFGCAQHVKVIGNEFNNWPATNVATISFSPSPFPLNADALITGNNFTVGWGTNSTASSNNCSVGANVTGVNFTGNSTNGAVSYAMQNLAVTGNSVFGAFGGASQNVTIDNAGDETLTQTLTTFQLAVTGGTTLDNSAIHTSGAGAITAVSYAGSGANLTGVATPATLAAQGTAITNWANGVFESLAAAALQGTAITNWANGAFATPSTLALQGTAITNWANGAFATPSTLALQGTAITNWANGLFQTLTGAANEGTAITNWANGVFETIAAAAIQGTAITNWANGTFLTTGSGASALAAQGTAITNWANATFSTGGGGYPVGYTNLTTNIVLNTGPAALATLAWSTNKCLFTQSGGFLFITNILGTGTEMCLLTNYFPSPFPYGCPPVVNAFSLGTNSANRGAIFYAYNITSNYFCVAEMGSGFTNTGYGIGWTILGQTNYTGGVLP